VSGARELRWPASCSPPCSSSDGCCSSKVHPLAQRTGKFWTTSPVRAAAAARTSPGSMSSRSRASPSSGSWQRCGIESCGPAFDRADGTRIWSLMQLERQLRPEAYGRRRGGYLDRRRIPATDAESIRASVLRHMGQSATAPLAKVASDLLHAMHGMPWRTPLLRAFAAGHGQSPTARWAALLSLAVPCFMPQTCPKGASGRGWSYGRANHRHRRRGRWSPAGPHLLLVLAAAVPAQERARGPRQAEGVEGPN
jgi:hypothetical protein